MSKRLTKDEAIAASAVRLAAKAVTDFTDHQSPDAEMMGRLDCYLRALRDMAYTIIVTPCHAGTQHQLTELSRMCSDTSTILGIDHRAKNEANLRAAALGRMVKRARAITPVVKKETDPS